MKRVSEKQINRLCQIVEEFLPAKHGFIVFAFPTEDAPDRYLRYASNCSIEDTVVMLKEWMLKRGYDEDWMRDTDDN